MQRALTTVTITGFFLSTILNISYTVVTLRATRNFVYYIDGAKNIMSLLIIGAKQWAVTDKKR